jgi:hypothetical protein
MLPHKKIWKVIDDILKLSKNATTNVPSKGFKNDSK